MLALGRFRTGISSAEEVLGLHRGGGLWGWGAGDGEWYFRDRGRRLRGGGLILL